MLDGRFIFGISPGGLASDAEAFGSLDANRQEMFLEGIDTVLKIWESEAPYNIEGKYWSVSTERTQMLDIGQGIMSKPLQQPHPPIVVTAVAPFSKGVTEAAARGWDPISANFLLKQWVKTHWPKYVEGCERMGRPADPANWRVARSVFVADDMDTAREYALGPQSPYRFYYNQLLTKMKKHGRANLFKADQNMHDDEVTLEGVLDECVIWGTPDKVADEILALRDEVGDFGTLLYAGKDWADVTLGKRSMVLLAEQALPLVNGAIDREKVAAQ
jgi:alkanesulfonate monooxygenase SsuD/methylene tetrahydromethanopterin reductase-like flavin-dependent oxidoreductase (luciferase family)